MWHTWCFFFYNLPHLHSPDILHTHWTCIFLHTLTAFTNHIHSFSHRIHCLISQSSKSLISINKVFRLYHLSLRYTSHKQSCNLNLKQKEYNDNTKLPDKYCNYLLDYIMTCDYRINDTSTAFCRLLNTN